MNLHYKEFGKRGNPCILVMHGFLGSSRNWATVSKLLENQYHIFTLDMRNHGESEHADSNSYLDMANDVKDFILKQDCPKPILLGHSMGGKVSMKFSCVYPHLLSKLIVIDIAPKTYSPHRKEIEAMQKVPLKQITSKKDAEEILAETITDFSLRKFLMTNLISTDKNEFIWRINIEGLKNNLDQLVGNPLSDEEKYTGHSYFIAGGKSSYLKESHHQTIYNHFPNATIHTIAESDHNPHFSTIEKFMTTLNKFLMAE